jgi:hypothetical protein
LYSQQVPFVRALAEVERRAEMVRLVRFLEKDTVIEKKIADGLRLAIDTIESLPDKTFSLRGAHKKYRKLPPHEVLKFIQEDLPPEDHYRSSVIRKINNWGAQYIVIEIANCPEGRGESRRHCLPEMNYVFETKV